MKKRDLLTMDTEFDGKIIPIFGEFWRKTHLHQQHIPMPILLQFTANCWRLQHLDLELVVGDPEQLKLGKFLHFAKKLIDFRFVT